MAALIGRPTDLTGRPTELSASELGDWDQRTVDRPGGHVLQSLAWGRHRAASGWHPHHLRFDDGVGVLVLVRPWPLLPGSGAYIPRGPIPADDPVEVTAARLRAVVDWLATRGVDVVATDAEVPASTGYRTLLAGMGFRGIEEFEPSRDRMSLALPPGADEASIWHGVAKSTRQRVRQAEDGGISIVRFDTRPAGGVGDGFEAEAGPGALDRALDRAYELLVATGLRRGFRLTSRADCLGWWRAAFDAGHLVLLEAREAGSADAAIATLVMYRHGRRLSTFLSGDRADARARHPGAFHLLRWRAIQLAVREGCVEMDLGGVDVAGARNEPRPGDPMAGLYAHKRSFGATWLELAGAHERVLDGRGYLAGRIVLRAAGLAGRVRARRDGR